MNDRVASPSSGARGGFRTYLAVLRQIAAASYFSSTLAVLVAVGLPVVEFFASPDVARFVFALSFVPSVAVGLWLGTATTRLWGAEMLGTVPRFRRSLMRVVAAIGLLFWASEVVSYALGKTDHGIVPWVDGVWLWDYGALGMGFYWGFFAGRQMPAWGRVLLILPTLLPAALPLLPGFRNFFFAANAPYTPANILCLLIGPHVWPILLGEVRVGPPLLQVSRDCAPERRRRGGAWIDAVIFQELAAQLHGRQRQRPELMLIPPASLGFLITPFYVALGVTLFHWVGHFPMDVSVVQTSFIFAYAMLATLPLAAPIDRRLLARYFVLPGAPSRRDIVHWLAFRYALSVGVAVAVLWLPSLLVAATSDIALDHVFQLLAGFAYSVVYATVAQILMLTFNWPRSPLQLAALALSACLLALSAIAFAAPGITATIEAGIALLGLVVFALLYAWAIRRWNRIDLDALGSGISAVNPQGSA